jgi:hypothetical protein
MRQRDAPAAQCAADASILKSFPTLSADDQRQLLAFAVDQT